MRRNLNIETITKELVERIANNSEVLEFFKKSETIEEFGIKYFQNNLVCGYDLSSTGCKDFISVLVDEYEGNRHVTDQSISMTYKVQIIVSHEDKSLLDRLSMLIGDIVTEAYPNRGGYCNCSTMIDMGNNYARIINFTLFSTRTDS